MVGLIYYFYVTKGFWDWFSVHLCFGYKSISTAVYFIL